MWHIFAHNRDWPREREHSHIRIHSFLYIILFLRVSCWHFLFMLFWDLFWMRVFFPRVLLQHPNILGWFLFLSTESIFFLFLFCQKIGGEFRGLVWETFYVRLQLLLPLKKVGCSKHREQKIMLCGVYVFLEKKRKLMPKNRKEQRWGQFLFWEMVVQITHSKKKGKCCWFFYIYFFAPSWQQSSSQKKQKKKSWRKISGQCESINNNKNIQTNTEWKKNVDGNFPLGIFQTKKKKKENENVKMWKTDWIFIFLFFFFFPAADLVGLEFLLWNDDLYMYSVFISIHYYIFYPTTFFSISIKIHGNYWFFCYFFCLLLFLCFSSFLFFFSVQFSFAIENEFFFCVLLIYREFKNQRAKRNENRNWRRKNCMCYGGENCENCGKKVAMKHKTWEKKTTLNYLLSIYRNYSMISFTSIVV